MIVAKTTVTEKGALPSDLSQQIRNWIAKQANKDICITLEEQYEIQNSVFQAMPIQDLIRDIEKFDSILQTPVRDLDLDGLYNYAIELDTWRSFGGRLLGSAQYWRDKQIQKVFLTADMSMLSSISATMQKRFIEAECAEMGSFYTFVDRMLAAAGHKIELIRSKTSYLKNIPV